METHPEGPSWPPAFSRVTLDLHEEARIQRAAHRFAVNPKSQVVAKLKRSGRSIYKGGKSKASACLEVLQVFGWGS